MESPIRLALHGPMFSGKSTLAKALKDNYQFQVLDYTDWGKSLCASALTTLLGREVTVEEVRARKNEWRDYIIWSLRIYGFDSGAGVQEMVMAAEETGLDDAVFDNIRYLSQYEALRPFGFRLVRLLISETEQQRRAELKGMPVEELIRLRRESSEVRLPGVPDEILLGVEGRTPDELAERLLSIALRPSTLVP